MPARCSRRLPDAGWRCDVTRIHLALTLDVEQWDSRSRADGYASLVVALAGVETSWFVSEDRTQSFSARYARLVDRLLAGGHELALHVHFQDAAFDQMAMDVATGTSRLRDLGAACVSFRGGGHVFSDRLADELLALGYRFDSSAVPGLVRRHHTGAGDTFAAYPHIWSGRPFWWRPGLLELPTASFPLSRPIAFFWRRFRLPVLLRQPRAFRAQLRELAAVYPAPDVPVVVLGHADDVEPDPARLSQALDELRGDPAIRFVTLARLGSEIASGGIAAGLRPPPSPLVRAAAVNATRWATGVSALTARAVRGVRGFTRRTGSQS